MGREVKRVALDFKWELGKVWEGYICPYEVRKCPTCEGDGYSPEARRFADQWSGNTDFVPTVPFSVDDTRLRALIPNRFDLIRRVAIYNACWSHHLTEEDVNALWKEKRLWDFKKLPTPEQVNWWSLRGLGHDSINCMICVEARCDREHVPYMCTNCNGSGTDPADAETERLAEEWQPTEPPAGDGWQVWETVSEGSPITPVFKSKEGLCHHLYTVGDLWDQHRGEGGWPIATASAFLDRGQALSLMVKGGVVLEPRSGA